MASGGVGHLIHVALVRGVLEFLPGAGGAPFSSRCRGSAVQLQVMMVILLERALHWGSRNLVILPGAGGDPPGEGEGLDLVPGEGEGPGVIAR